MGPWVAHTDAVAFEREPRSKIDPPRGQYLDLCQGSVQPGNCGDYRSWQLHHTQTRSWFLSTIMLSDSPQCLIPPSQAHLAPPTKSRIAHQPSPTAPMSMSQNEEKAPLRLRGGCIPCGVRLLSVCSYQG